MNWIGATPQPNVVPALAKVWYYLRETDVAGVRANFAICNRIADGAAMMTDTSVTRRMLGASWPRHYNRILAETVQANIERTGLPDWTEDDQRFARAVVPAHVPDHAQIDDRDRRDFRIRYFAQPCPHLGNGRARRGRMRGVHCAAHHVAPG